MNFVCRTLLALCLSPIVVAADLVILESTSPDYPSGEILDDTTQIELSEDGEITLIAEDGTIISLSGPFIGSPSLDAIQNVSGVLDALGRLVGTADVSATDIGGVRGDEEGDDFLARAVDDTRTSPWTLHTNITGAQCVIADAQEIRFWRENADNTEQLRVKHIGTASNNTIEWQAGNQTVTWPSGLPLVANDLYLVRLGDDLRSTTLQLREIPAAVNRDGVAVVAFLAAKGCISQARMEFDRLRRES